MEKSLYFSQFILNGFNKLKLGFRTILATIDFSKALDLPGIPFFATNFVSASLSFSLLVELNLSFVIGVLACFLKSRKPLLSSPSRCSARIRSWPCTFLSFHQ